jgi:hypothetical protein
MPIHRLMVCLLVLFSTTPAVALEVGWGGFYKPGRWVEVRATLPAESRPMGVTAKLYVPGEGAFGQVIEARQVLNEEPMDVALLMRPVARLDDLTLRLAEDATGRTIEFEDEVLAEPVLGERVLIGVSGQGNPLEPLAASAEDARQEDLGLAVGFVGPDALPTEAAGFDALDLLVLDRPATATLGRKRQAALAAWVRGGGRLVLIVGVDAPDPRGSLVPLLPAVIGEVQPSGIRQVLVGGKPIDEAVATVGLGAVAVLAEEPPADAAYWLGLIERLPVVAPRWPEPPAVAEVTRRSWLGLLFIGGLVVALGDVVLLLCLKRRPLNLGVWATAGLAALAGGLSLGERARPAPTGQTVHAQIERGDAARRFTLTTEPVDAPGLWSATPISGDATLRLTATGTRPAEAGTLLATAAPAEPLLQLQGSDLRLTVTNRSGKRIQLIELHQRGRVLPLDEELLPGETATLSPGESVVGVVAEELVVQALVVPRLTR